MTKNTLSVEVAVVSRNFRPLKLILGNKTRKTLAINWPVKTVSIDGKLMKVNAGEVAERLKAAVC